MSIFGEWSVAHETRLAELWASGLSAGQITGELPFTRSAILGKVHRLKLPARGMGDGRRRQQYKAQPPAPRPENKPLNRSFDAAPAPPVTSEGRVRNPTRLQTIANGHDLGLAPPQRRNPSHNILAKIAIAETEPGLPEKLKGEKPEGAGVKLIDLKPDSCRWPRGDPASPDFEFCGGKSLPDLPYCSRHSRLAYAPPKARVAADKWAMHRADIQS